MAITSYLRECSYSLGGLMPKMYLIHKNALKLSFKAKGVEVTVTNNKDGDIYLVEGTQCTYKEEETLSGKYRFNSMLEFHINEMYKEPFLYGLRTLRENQYYIVIEDKNGVQYLINPELYTKMTYEYTFSDESENVCVITYNNLSNYPLLIFDKEINNTKSFVSELCEYNYGRIYELLMFDHKELKIKDDGVRANEMYIDGTENIHQIDYLKESISLQETYDGVGFITTLSFSIPLNDMYGWAYNLIEYEDNRYKAIIRTTNDNYIIIGNERGLQASYNIETSEEDSAPNMVNIKLEQRSQYPLLYTDELTQYRWTESGEMCFGFNRYQMLKKEYSEDWGNTWVVVDPIVKKKGKILEEGSEDCKKYQWVDDESYCRLDKTYYEKWVDGNDFICENGNKYYKSERYISDNGVSFNPTGEYGRGALIETDSKECEYVAVRWVEDNGYECYVVNEDLTRWIQDNEMCSGTTLYEGEYEEVTSNGVQYYESGDRRLGDVIREDCCACGYREEEWRDVGVICGKDIKSQITKYEGDWIVNGDTFTSNKTNNFVETIQRIYFTGAAKLILEIDQSAHTMNYLFIGKIDTPVTTTDYLISWEKKTTGTTSITVSDYGEHFIELMFEKGNALVVGRDDVIVKFIIDKGDIVSSTKYSEQNKHLVCNDGVDVVDETTSEMRYNVAEEKCYECGYVSYMWKMEDVVCYDALPEGIEISEVEIETNVDKGEYING